MADLYDDDTSQVNMGFGCRPSYNTYVKGASTGKQFDPYEPHNDNVFEANEENILDDALYVYDYLNQVIGIE